MPPRAGRQLTTALAPPDHGSLRSSWIHGQTEAELETEPISWADFERVDMRVGRVLEAEPFPEARNPAIKLRIDFGPMGIKQSSAQITLHYTPEVLVGRLVVAVVNFPPKRIAGFRSEVLVLGGVPEAGNVVLLAPDLEVPLGTRIA
jgi:tRNA-binding protein